MKFENRTKQWLILLLCVVMAAGVIAQGALAASAKGEPTEKCTNMTSEGIEYYIPFKVSASDADDWRSDLHVKVENDSGGKILGMELEVTNHSTRYQCTQMDSTDPVDYSCNSVPVGATVTGVYLLYVPSVTENTKVQFIVDTIGTQKRLLTADATVKYPAAPCSRNYLVKDFAAKDGEALIVYTCNTPYELEFLERSEPFTLVNIIPTDTLNKDRVKMSVTPSASFSYTLTLYFTTDPDSWDISSPGSDTVVYSYDAATGVGKVDSAAAFDSKTNGDLPIYLMGGKIHDLKRVNDTDINGNKVFPTSADLNIKLWYENNTGTLGYENSIFHFERNLNFQFSYQCDNAGYATAQYDNCQASSQIFNITLPSAIKIDTITNSKGDEHISTPTKAYEKAPNYMFMTRKCANTACTYETTTNAYPYSLTVSNGNTLSLTVRNNALTHKPGTRTYYRFNAWGTNKKPLAITGMRLLVEEPGTYVIYGFVKSSAKDKTHLVASDYTVKMYVTVTEKDMLDTCSTLANNGYFKAYWNDCLDYRQTQLMTFEHIPDTEEAWIMNRSAHGVHFPYVAEWSYVPQGLEVASLTCRAEALTSAGQPGNAYCRPNDVYVPPYTKVTITGGTMYLDGTPEYDEYRVAYMRQDTYNISHLFFSVQVKECENVKRIPDTGISLRSPLKVNESVDAATSYVFTGNSLQIPAIGLGMEYPIPIVHVYYEEGSADLGWDLSTLGNYVGELEGGSYLPYAGNSALTGHYYSAGVFKNLENLNLDDEIIIYGNDGIKYTYRVTEKFLAQPTDVYEMFQQVGERSLTLVTCENYNLVTDEYERRQLVRATIDHQEPYEANW